MKTTNDNQQPTPTALAAARCCAAPGSDEAVKAGCKCPVLDNSRGKGYMGLNGVYVYNMECPLHAETAEKQFHQAHRRWLRSHADEAA